MATVRVEQRHSKSPAEAREAVKSFEDQLTKFGMKAEWKGNNATLKGTGASGSIDVLPDKVVVEVKLGMLARAAGIDAGRLEQSIKKRLSAALET